MILVTQLYNVNDLSRIHKRSNTLSKQLRVLLNFLKTHSSVASPIDFMVITRAFVHTVGMVCMTNKLHIDIYAHRMHAHALKRPIVVVT